MKECGNETRSRIWNKPGQETMRKSVFQYWCKTSLPVCTTQLYSAQDEVPMQKTLE